METTWQAIPKEELRQVLSSLEEIHEQLKPVVSTSIAWKLELVILTLKAVTTNSEYYNKEAGLK